MTHYGVVAGPTSSSPGTPLCLDVDFDASTAGTSLGQYLDNGLDAQRFIFELQTDGSYKIRHKNTPMYVQPVGLNPAVNTQIEQNVASASNYQRWIITDPNNNGRYKFALKGTSSPVQCLEVGFGSDVPGARVNLFDDNGFEPAQRWVLTLIAQPTATKNADELALSLQAYPNPSRATERSSVRITTLRSGPATVHVVDALGQRVSAQEVDLRAGGNVLALGTGPLAAGLYLVQVRQGELTQQTRLVQQ